jgi:hypothetical protein
LDYDFAVRLAAVTSRQVVLDAVPPFMDENKQLAARRAYQNVWQGAAAACAPEFAA